MSTSQTKEVVMPEEKDFELKSNTVGMTEERKLREKAKLVLVKARKIESNKLLMGYRWMHQGKTMKLVSPSKILEEQAKGFILNKK